MKKYLSIQRNMRGFSYTKEFNTKEEYRNAMVFQRDNENNEVEWSKLINTETGKKEAVYYRGMNIET
jgi:hypothetical protein